MSSSDEQPENEDLLLPSRCSTPVLGSQVRGLSRIFLHSIEGADAGSRRTF